MVWSSRAFGKIKRGDLPPTSRPTRFGLPTSVEPVDVTLSMPALEDRNAGNHDRITLEVGSQHHDALRSVKYS